MQRGRKLHSKSAVPPQLAHGPPHAVFCASHNGGIRRRLPRSPGSGRFSRAHSQPSPASSHYPPAPLKETLLLLFPILEILYCPHYITMWRECQIQCNEKLEMVDSAPKIMALFLSGRIRTVPGIWRCTAIPDSSLILFYCYRLCQISRLVYVVPLLDACEVGKKLHGDD